MVRSKSLRSDPPHTWGVFWNSHGVSQAAAPKTVLVCRTQDRDFQDNETNQAKDILTDCGHKPFLTIPLYKRRYISRFSCLIPFPRNSLAILDSYHVTFSTNEIASFWHCFRKDFWRKNSHSAQKYSYFEYFY